MAGDWSRLLRYRIRRIRQVSRPFALKMADDGLRQRASLSIITPGRLSRVYIMPATNTAVAIIDATIFSSGFTLAGRAAKQLSRTSGAALMSMITAREYTRFHCICRRATS